MSGIEVATHDDLQSKRDQQCDQPTLRWVDGFYGALTNQRLFPAIDIAKSSTRREELLIDVKDIEKVRALRRGLTTLKPVEGAQKLLALLDKYPTNAELLDVFLPDS